MEEAEACHGLPYPLQTKTPFRVHFTYYLHLICMLIQLTCSYRVCSTAWKNDCPWDPSGSPKSQVPSAPLPGPACCQMSLAPCVLSALHLQRLLCHPAAIVPPSLLLLSEGEGSTSPCLTPHAEEPHSAPSCPASTAPEGESEAAGDLQRELLVTQMLSAKRSQWPEVRVGQVLGPSEQEGHPSYSPPPPLPHPDPISMAALSPPKPWAPGEVAQSQFF